MCSTPLALRCRSVVISTLKYFAHVITDSGQMLKLLYKNVAQTLERLCKMLYTVREQNLEI